MVPSEAEIEARLAALRRRREGLDREIADHLLYLELGRRLRGAEPPGPVRDPLAPESVAPQPFAPQSFAPQSFAPDDPSMPPPGGDRGPGAPAPPAAARPEGWRAPAMAPPTEVPAPAAVAPPPASELGGPAGLAPVPPMVAFEADPAGARSYGRALADAALAILTEVGRPMHAGEILEHLVARGFTVPGQDPVAALNTRLWKRAAPGGPLRRLGEAIYDRADGAGSAESFGIL